MADRSFAVGPLKWESEGDVVRFYYRCSQLKIARFRVTISVKAAWCLVILEITL